MMWHKWAHEGYEITDFDWWNIRIQQFLPMIVRNVTISTNECIALKVA